MIAAVDDLSRRLYVPVCPRIRPRFRPHDRVPSWRRCEWVVMAATDRGVSRLSSARPRPARTWPQPGRGAVHLPGCCRADRRPDPGPRSRWTARTSSGCRSARRPPFNCWQAAPEVVDHALLSGALVRGLPGAGLVRPTIAAYMPFRNIPALVRANMRSSAIPADYYQPFSEDTRALTVDALTHVLVANMTFRLPPGLDRVKAAVLGDGWKQRIRHHVRLCTRCPRSHPRRARLRGERRSAQLAADRSWSVQLDCPCMD